MSGLLGVVHPVHLVRDVLKPSLRRFAASEHGAEPGQGVSSEEGKAGGGRTFGE